MKLRDLTTPCALVDLDVLERNCRVMRERTAALGVRLRPHVKTHKCVEIARRQVGGHFGGITVSTLAEAHFFADGGFRDITWAVAPDPARLGEARELHGRIDRLSLLLDSEETFRRVEEAAAAREMRLPVFLKVDCGYHRAGVDPARPESVALAAALAASPHVELRGLLTHAGFAYRSRSAQEAKRAAATERKVVAGFAEILRAEGIAVEEVSLGSTPTLSGAETLDGVTEARPGNYAFFDVFQAAIGSCRLTDVALSVLAAVIGSYPERGSLLLNAGSLALSRDPGPRHVDPGCGFGRLVPLEGGAPLTGLRLAALSQEHGQVEVEDPALFERFPVGSRLRILPNHSCLTAALHERYHVEKGGNVVDEWRPARGW